MRYLWTAFRRMPRLAAGLAVLAAALLVGHQVAYRLGLRGYWADAYLDDVCGMLLWLYLLEWEQRRLWQWRQRPFRGYELAVLVVLWSVFFEALLPRWHSGYTADAWDVLAYTAGALLYYGSQALTRKKKPSGLLTKA